MIGDFQFDANLNILLPGEMKKCGYMVIITAGDTEKKNTEYAEKKISVPSV